MPATVLAAGGGDTQSHNRVGNCQVSTVGTKILFFFFFLVHLIPPLQPLLPGLELEKEESPDSGPWEGKKGRKGEGEVHREQGDRPGRVGEEWGTDSLGHSSWVGGVQLRT